MFTSLNLKRDYIVTATAALSQQLSPSIEATLADIEINATLAVETNYLVADCAACFRMLYQMDDECNAHPEKLTEQQWVSYWEDLESQIAQLLAPARDLIRISEQLAAQGASVPDLQALKEAVAEAEGILAFPQDYGATAKYQALADETEQEQAAGKLEEGGWE